MELICSRVAQIVREEEEKGAAGANKKSNVQQKWEEAARKNSKAPTIGTCSKVGQVNTLYRKGSIGGGCYNYM